MGKFLGINNLKYKKAIRFISGSLFCLYTFSPQKIPDRKVQFYQGFFLFLELIDKEAVYTFRFEWKLNLF
jgi:hypothetical protein